MSNNDDAATLRSWCSQLARDIDRLSTFVISQSHSCPTFREACAELEGCTRVAYRLQRWISGASRDKALDPDGGSEARLVEAQLLLEGQCAVFRAVADSFLASEGVDPAVRDEALGVLAEALQIHQRLEVAVEGVRILLIEHDADYQLGRVSAEVSRITRKIIGELQP
ncbi:hypothetical protein LRF89_12900 [Halorhodospira sp. 9621]|uniref:hypothetical protein n=2 Tax=Ectothiorhodospiraceae TaxID=72276 RepID=UPI001EE7B319|nr:MULTISPECIES: hypothetical protein [Halorhodospira]MCG5529200.1 hypothetical protein [Halorhodospira halophila]MCG5534332.1 hypothetical protein [Halorhodospira sp. 9621]MCG5543109.1 hypothetical protein [Halorhodospira sp. 9628]